MLKNIIDNKDIGALIMRLGIATVFLWGGFGKFFGWFGGPGLEQFATEMVWGSLGLAILVATIELIGGITALIGTFTREITAILGIIILVALFAVHIPSGNIMDVVIHIMLLTNLIGMSFIGSGKYALKED